MPKLANPIITQIAQVVKRVSNDPRSQFPYIYSSYDILNEPSVFRKRGCGATAVLDSLTPGTAVITGIFGSITAGADGLR
jgi:3-deoxy-D-manno-octulosonic acid (KDO) 8-phosphate synthase